MLVRDRLNLFPLRQMVSVSGDAEHVFARQGLLDWLSRPERYQIISHGQGGQIFAIGEPALGEAQALLREAYGGLIGFGGVTVHSYVDGQPGTVMIPIMFLRVDAPRAHGHKLLQLLKDRSIDAQEIEFQRDRVVIRAEVPLSKLLGVERLIAELTDSSAHTMCWLLRYQAALAQEQSAASGQQL
jgi:hypothetical protein